MYPRRSPLNVGQVAMALLAVSFLAANAFATAPIETAIYSFLSTPDGASPQGGLVADAAGNLYGTTAYAGSHGGGTIFELSPPATAGGDWLETILYNFRGGNDARPNGSLIFDNAGNLYGTAIGACCDTYFGSVFELSPPTTPGGAWTETVLWASDTSNQNSGLYPVGNLVLDAAGNLYGSTYSGGLHGGGVAYELLAPATPGGTRTQRILHDFGAAGDGKNPAAGLLLHNGILYGTTLVGAHSTYGIAFQLTRKPGRWTETILYTFTAASGLFPRETLIADNAGNLYGVTSSDGNSGAAFELSPPAVAGDPWQETTLHVFANNGDGAGPVGRLLRDKNGNLYGTTARWGKGGGSVFKLKPPATAGGSWTYVFFVGFPFSGDTPRLPSGGLTFLNGVFYGVSELGGTRDAGTVYNVVP